MENKANIAKALMAFQSECPAIIKDSNNPFFKSKYADLATIWETIKPFLTKNGLAISQLLNGDKLLTVLFHESGEEIASSYPVVVPDITVTENGTGKDGKLVTTVIKKTDPQAFGAAVTYARRYALSAILSLVTDDDDDGETAMNRKNPLVDKQKELIALLKDEVVLAQEIKAKLKITNTVDKMTEKELDAMIEEAKNV